MKIIRYFGLLVMILPITNCFGQDGDSKEALKNGVAAIREVWTEWLKKPPFESEINHRDLPEIVGIWVAEIERDSKKIELKIVVNQNGTWSSKVFRPEMKKGYWYLSEGIILLYESKISDDSCHRGFFGLASALFEHKGKLRLLYGENELGYLELVKEQPPKVKP